MNKLRLVMLAGVMLASSLPSFASDSVPTARTSVATESLAMRSEINLLSQDTKSASPAMSLRPELQAQFFVSNICRLGFYYCYEMQSYPIGTPCGCPAFVGLISPN